jgi:hypothetical protein
MDVVGCRLSVVCRSVGLVRLFMAVSMALIWVADEVIL